jgi:hypothetical protein
MSLMSFERENIKSDVVVPYGEADHYTGRSDG